MTIGYASLAAALLGGFAGALVQEDVAAVSARSYRYRPPKRLRPAPPEPQLPFTPYETSPIAVAQPPITEFGFDDPALLGGETPAEKRLRR